MKIGIDAKWYFNGPVSGKVVVKNLLDNIIKCSEFHTFYIFLNKSDRGKALPPFNENIIPVYVWGKNDLISNILLIKRKAHALGLDAVLFQNFPAISTRFYSISYIHDILYLSHPQYFGCKERLYFFPLLYLARKSKLIITISNSEKERLLKYKFSEFENKIKVVYHGVNDRYKPLIEHEKELIEKINLKYSLPKEFLLYVGRMNIRKNIRNLLLALKDVTYRNIPLVIIGTRDSKMFDIDTFIKRENLSGRVIFLGYVPDEELNIIFARATIFCFLSFAEGFGLPVLEAMASGIPVVTSNTSSMPEVAGGAAVLVAPDSVSEIANGINSLLSDKNLFNSHISKGLKRVSLFSWYKSANQLINFIEKIE